MRASFRILLTGLALLVLVSVFFLCREPLHDGFPGLITAPATQQAPDGRDRASEWFLKKRFAKRRGVAIVIHGLNLKPERMGSVIAALNRTGIDVLNVSLSGHGDNYESSGGPTAEAARLETFRNVSYPVWQREVLSASRKAGRRAERKKVPLILVGYSLGGLLGCDLVLMDAGSGVRRMILFAPALNVQLEAHLLKVLTPFPSLVIDSLSPRWYRSNDGTPMAAYRTLFEVIGRVDGNAGPRLNIPTLVLIDPGDEFISTEKIRELITGRGLSRWRVLPVRKDVNVAAAMSHHLIIDEAAVGRNAWMEVEKAVIDHILKTEADS